MIVDKLENTDEHAWTKLLDSKDLNEAVVIKFNNENIKECPNSSTDLPSEQQQLHQQQQQQQQNKKETFFGTFHRQLRMSLKGANESPGPITRYRQTRFSSRRIRKRVVFKQGDCNVVQGNVAKRRRRYMQDIFTTLVDARWRWTLLVFALSFLLSWTAFGLVWWIIAYAHGDLDYLEQLKLYNSGDLNNLTQTPTNDSLSLSPSSSSSSSSTTSETFTVCVTEIHSLTSAFLFSVETQHTIGYGNRYITEECPEAIFVMCLQSIMGVFIQAFMVGIVFAKLSRPKKRAQTLLFSRNAVICHRDGIPCLMFRVGDMRKSHIVEAHVRAQIIRKKVTKEGEILPFYQQELIVGADGGEDRLMFIWPTTIVHKIDRHSPLYALSAQDMLKERFEIIVMLEGVVESTGMTTQARSSYLPSEILWGHRFEHVVSFKKETGEYEVDYTLFNNTYEVDTPLCSAKQLDEVRAELNTPNGFERLCTAGLIPRVSSAGSLDPPSDESIESNGRLQFRSNSIPNTSGIPSNLLMNNNNNNSYNTTTSSLTVSMVNNNNSNLNNTSINNKSNNNNNHNNKSYPKRLSVKQDQIPVDSIC